MFWGPPFVCYHQSNLSLSGNIITNLTRLRHNPSLETLELRSAHIKSIPTSFALDVPRLRHLDLDDNAVVNIGGLKGLKELAWLSLRDNGIADFGETLKGLKTLERIGGVDLRYASFSCCHICLTSHIANFPPCPILKIQPNNNPLLHPTRHKPPLNTPQLPRRRRRVQTITDRLGFRPSFMLPQRPHQLPSQNHHHFGWDSGRGG